MMEGKKGSDSDGEGNTEAKKQKNKGKPQGNGSGVDTLNAKIQRLEQENSKLKKEVTDMKKKLDYAETRERIKDTRITNLSTDLEKVETRITDLEKDCTEWEQIDRERDKITLSLQQTVAILQKDLDKLIEEKEGGGISTNNNTDTKDTEDEPKKIVKVKSINFATPAYSRHEYPPEEPSDDDSDSSSIEISLSDDSSESGDENVPGKKSFVGVKKENGTERHIVDTVQLELGSPPKYKVSLPPPKPATASSTGAPSLKFAGLGIDSSTDIFSLMATNNSVLQPESTKPEVEPEISKIAAEEPKSPMLEDARPIAEPPEYSESIPTTEVGKPTPEEIPELQSTPPNPSPSKPPRNVNLGFDPRTDLFSMMARGPEPQKVEDVEEDEEFSPSSSSSPSEDGSSSSSEDEELPKHKKGSSSSSSSSGDEELPKHKIKNSGPSVAEPLPPATDEQHLQPDEVVVTQNSIVMSPEPSEQLQIPSLPMAIPPPIPILNPAQPTSIPISSEPVIPSRLVITPSETTPLNTPTKSSNTPIITSNQTTPKTPTQTLSQPTTTPATPTTPSKPEVKPVPVPTTASTPSPVKIVPKPIPRLATPTSPQPKTPPKQFGFQGLPPLLPSPSLKSWSPKTSAASPTTPSSSSNNTPASTPSPNTDGNSPRRDALAKSNSVRLLRALWEQGSPPVSKDSPK